METWLNSYSPQKFSDLAMPLAYQETLIKSSLDANPPHILLAGPSGVGKTATWKLLARQVLGPSWELSTHIFQAKDALKKAGAMKAFENFLRPTGNDSQDTLAGRTTLTSFDSSMWEAEEGDDPPAGRESNHENPISRLFIIEDADFLGSRRQAFLRRMMEREATVSRFIFTARAPSRLIDALRSRCLLIRTPTISNEAIKDKLIQILKNEGLTINSELLDDVVHISSGNLRKSIFLTELLAERNLLNDRDTLHKVISSTTLVSTRRMIENALRGNVIQWEWEQKGTRNVRVMKGALNELDILMKQHFLDGEDIINQIHELLLSGRFFIKQEVLTDILSSLSKCNIRLNRSMHPRIQLEAFLHDIAMIGRTRGIAIN
ncbi:MAG: hypothetical protein CMB64_06380 [Euryarchaeota archaeon]|nr:hypothetical protein [Euryarchaeota archaeon]